MEGSMLCPACRRQVPHDARYCPLCGERMHVVAYGTPTTGAGTGLLPPQHCLRGRYVIVRKLAQGGQSAVYLAMDRLVENTRRAIKEMSQAHLLPHERERAINQFMREAQLLQQLDHPMLAKVYEWFTEGDKHYLAMEYVPGKTIEDEMMELGRPLDWEPVVRWSAMLCDVLGYLHAQTPPIVYRDLKPANVMLTPDGRLKLIDFGIARRLVPARLHDTAQLGTDGYAPLEQYASKSEPRSDLYALGASLYHLLTGRVPENAPMRSSGANLKPIRAISPRVPAAVERVVMQALSLHPDERYQDAYAMQQALEALLPREEPASARSNPSRAGGKSASSPSVASSPTGRMKARAANAPPPKLYVWPIRVDAGAVTTRIDVDLEIANRGGGELVGEVESSASAVVVNPVRVDGATTLVRVRIDPAGVSAGAHSCHVAVRTNGGDQIIPVRFTAPEPSGMRRAHAP